MTKRYCDRCSKEINGTPKGGISKIEINYEIGSATKSLKGRIYSLDLCVECIFAFMNFLEET